MSRLISLAARMRVIVPLALCCLLSPIVRAQALLDGFDPSANSNVYALVVQPDGKILVGGAFITLQPHKIGLPAERQRIARLNADGTLDPTFFPAFNGDVLALALQSDGKIIVGGKFTQIAPPNAAKWEDCNGLARLNADGTWDSAFQPNPGGAISTSPLVRSLAVQADGKILVGGGFTTMGTAARNYIARLNTDGTVDAGFDPNANNVVLSLAVQRDGKILMGGGFTKLGPTATSIARLRLARLNPNGSVDDAFDPKPGNRVLAIAVQPDGKILVGGDFQSLKPGADTEATGRAFVARLTSGGLIDTNFNPTASASVSAITIQTDGKILLGGRFTWFRASGSGTLTERRYIARLGPDGSIDDTFSPRASSEVAAIGVQADNNIVIAGYFTSVLGNNAGANVARGRLARLRPDGSLDTAFTVDAGGQVSALARQRDGKTIVAGSFRNFAGNSRANIARVDANGTLDASFYPVVDGSIFAVAVQDDGKIVIGGSFTLVGATEPTYLARLNADGSLDTGFNPKPNGNVGAIAIQPSDQKILIGGSFTTVQPNGATTTTARLYMARINTDGTIDTAFNPNPNSQVSAITLQGDGKILVGGNFTTFQPNATGSTLAHRYIARVNADGTIEDAFAPNPDKPVSAIAVQPSDQKIIIGGQFVEMQPAGATTATTRLRVARINTNGSLDTTFDPTANGPVSTIAILSDGKILLGGGFTALKPNGATDAITRTFLAWLNSDGSLATGREFQVDNQVVAISVQGAQALVGGAFSTVIDPSGAGSLVDDHLVRLNTEPAAIDTTFVVRGPPTAGSSIGAIAFQSDGKLIVGGTFPSLAGGSSAGIGRVFADGIPDSTFRTQFDGAVHAILTIPERKDNVAGSGTVAWLNADGSFRADTDFSRAITSQFSGTVNAVAVQADGKLLVGGLFTNNNGQTSPNFARLNADGTLDTTFDPAPNEAINAIAVQPDGKIVVGGAFTSITGVTRNNIARLNANGTLDTAFDPNANGAVVAVSIVAGDKILVGGAFTTVTPNGATTAVARTYFARLNADGTADTAFNPAPNGTVRSFVVQSDNSIVIGGFFTAVGSTTRNHLARVDTNGVVDANYNPNCNGNVHVLAQQKDGKVVVGGNFGAFTPNAATDATARQFIARVNTDGTLDTAFNPTANSQVNSISLQSDGAMLVGGAFTAFAPNGATTATARNYLARLNADGTVDLAFNPNANNLVQVVQVQATGTILVGGAFTALHPDATLLIGGAFTTVDGAPVPYLARLSSDGTPDVNFKRTPDKPVHALAMQADGRILVAGDFTTFSGVAKQRLARLDADGTLETAFEPQIDGAVYALAIQPDGRILIGGDFANVGGAPHLRLARLAADGTVDSTFTASADNRVTAIAAQADGRVLVSGQFTTINGTGRTRIARLESNGTLNTAFNPGANGAVWSLGLQADGKILAGGAFTQIAGVAKAHLARLQANGTLDTTFTAESDADVRAIAIQTDGRPTVGGDFTVIGGLTRNLVARIPNAGQATQSLAVSSDLKKLTWTRGGPAGEFSSVVFSYSTDASTWSTLGTATRSGALGAWELSGLNLPANTLYYVRARCVSLVSQYASSGFLDIAWQFYGTIPAGRSSTSAATATGSGTDSSAGTTGNGTGTGDGSSSGNDGSSSSGGNDNGSGSGTGSGTNGSASGINNLINFSVRVQIGNVDPLISGFVVGGTTSQKVLIRAVGPGLSQFGVAGTMSAPQLALFDSTGQMIQSKAAWGGDAALASTVTDVGAFALDPASTDSAIAATLAPGTYTIHARDGVAPGGVVLAEIYVVTEGGGLANLSARGPVGSGTSVFIGGFIVGGDTPRKMLIRGVGPGLQAFNVTDAIVDPSIRVLDSHSAVVAENDDWGTQSGTGVSDTTSANTATQAFALATGSKDSALVVTLPPGAYTVHLSGTTSGSALVEVYEVP